MITVAVRARLMSAPDLAGALYRGMERSVELVVRRAQDLVSGVVVRRRTGRLWRAINGRVEARAGYLVGIVGVARREGFHAAFLEGGSRPHALNKGARLERAPTRARPRGARPQRGRQGSVLAIPVGGQVIFRTKAKHPGIAPRRFLAQAAEGAKREVQAIFQQEAARAAAQAAARG